MIFLYSNCPNPTMDSKATFFSHSSSQKTKNLQNKVLFQNIPGWEALSEILNFNWYLCPKPSNYPLKEQSIWTKQKLFAQPCRL